MALSNRFILTAAVMALSLAGCGESKKDASLAELDAQLTNNAVDPALKGALEDQIVVDPNLAGQSNRNAVRSADKSANGALPVLSGDAAKASAEALKLAGGKLMSAPAPTAAKAGAPAATLGALARQQGGKGCTDKLKYDMQWASRLPEPFAVYPGAQLMEAAGADEGKCAVRAASFVTAVPKQGVIDYYYTLARRAGYDAEHQVMDGDNVLGGTRGSDAAAYFIVFTDAPGGRTTVDIIADNGV